MLSKMINLVPRDWLILLYKHTPFTRFKNWVVYRAQHKFLVSVLGVITNDEGKVLLLKHVYRKQPWGIPGGWMELEKPEDGLTREIFEETGLKVQIIGLSRAIFGQKPNRVDLVFKGRIIEGTFIRSTEISEILYCSIGSWPDGLPTEQKKLIKEILSDG